MSDTKTADGPVIASDLFDTVMKLRKRRMAGERAGLATGLTSVDEVLDGLHGLVVIGGWPGVGKSSLAVQVGTDAAEQAEAVCLIQSAEMAPSLVVDRMLTRYEQGRPGSIPAEALSTRYHAMAKRLVIESSDKLSHTSELTEQIDRLREKGDTRHAIVIVDSVHAVAQQSFHHKSRPKDVIDRYLHELVEVAHHPNTCVIALAHQPKSAGEGFFFSESNGFDYLADVTAVLVASGNSKRTLEIKKNRHGKTGNVDLRFDGKSFSFTDYGSKAKS